MITRAVVLSLGLALGGCTSGPSSTAADGRTPSTYPPLAYEEHGEPPNRAGQVAVSVVGTPFLLAFKTVVCAGSLVVAAPAAALLTLVDGPSSGGVRILGDGVAKNCGPPYVLTPRGT